MATARDERWVPVSGTSLRVVVVGSGPELLLLNGIGAGAELWEPLVERLQHTRRLVLVDMPGAGGSAPLRRPARMPALATIVVRVLDALGLGRVDVLGYSWGGALAQQLAHDHPSRVRRLCLVSTTPGWGGRPPSPRAVANLATMLTAGADGGHQRPARPDPWGCVQQLYAISGWSSVWWLRRVRARTLILCGDADGLAPTQNASLMACLMRDATVHVAVGGGHFWLLESADDSTAVIDRFLSADDNR